MLRFCLISLTLLAFLGACNSKKKLVLNQNEQFYHFPIDWIGHYEGNLLIFDSLGDTNTVLMKLAIGNPNAEGFYSWIIQYGDEDIREYGLEAVNTDKGHYLIDEYNSIRLHGYLRDNHFISRFEVMESDLLVDYERVKEGILVNLYVSRSKELSTTGGQIFDKDTVPNVRSFEIPVFQRALLRKRQ